MAARNCPECGGLVASTINVCPHCGFILNDGISRKSLIVVIRSSRLILIPALRGQLFRLCSFGLVV